MNLFTSHYLNFVFFSYSHTYYEAFVMLILANDLINNTVQLISLFLNLFLCIDLVLTLWSPFNVTRGRLKYYSFLSVALASFLVIFIYYD